MSNTDLIRGRQVAIPLINNSSSTCTPGMVVILSPGLDQAFELTEEEGHEDVVGVVDETIHPDEEGRIVCAGYVAQVLTDGPVARGDYLVTSTTPGKATGKVSAPGLGILGIALTSGLESVEAFLFHTVRGSQGPQGEKGDKGDKGDTGAQGPPGPTGGADTQVLFNDAGTTAGSPGLVFDKNTNTLTVGNRIEAVNADKVKVSSNDTTPGPLEDKLTGGTGITLTVENPGGNESLRIDSATGKRTVIMSRASTLEIAAYPFHIYPGVNGTIYKVRIGVSSPPVGASVIVDVEKNNTTIFTEQAHRPVIASEAIVGVTTDIDEASIDEDDFLTFSIDQVGSSLPGSYLTVQVYIQED